ncbi:MAG: DsrE family protein, partial [Candidatus Bathyarchaeia archaeon]
MRLLLIILSPPRARGLHTVVNLAEAALRRGHEGIIFCTGDGVENMRKDRVDPLTPRLSRLLGEGVRVLVCRESARRRGLLTEAGLMEGVEMSSLAEMVELM